MQRILRARIQSISRALRLCQRAQPQSAIITLLRPYSAKAAAVSTVRTNEDGTPNLEQDDYYRLIFKDAVARDNNKGSTQPSSESAQSISPSEDRIQEFQRNLCSDNDWQGNDVATKTSTMHGDVSNNTSYTIDRNPEETTTVSQQLEDVLPRPSEPDNCCMSGCVSCVWETYREELESWMAKNQIIGRKPEHIKLGNKTEALASEETEDSRHAITSNASSLDDNDGDIYAGLPVGIREFMKQEKLLKAQKLKD